MYMPASIFCIWASIIYDEQNKKAPLLTWVAGPQQFFFQEKTSEVANKKSNNLMVFLQKYAHTHH